MPHVIGTVDKVLENRYSETLALPFGDIAPLHVYHAADTSFRKEAQAAFRKLAKAKNPLVEGRHDHDDFYPRDTTDAYNAAFLKVLSNEGLGDWEFEIDEAGCYRVIDPVTAERRFGGDAPSNFAFYADETSLVSEVRRTLERSPSL